MTVCETFNVASVLLECFEVLQCIVISVCGQTVCELVTLAAEVRSSMAMLCELEERSRVLEGQPARRWPRAVVCCMRWGLAWLVSVLRL